MTLEMLSQERIEVKGLSQKVLDLNNFLKLKD